MYAFYPSAFGCKGYCHEHDGPAGGAGGRMGGKYLSTPVLCSVQNDLKLICYVDVIL